MVARTREELNDIVSPVWVRARALSPNIFAINYAGCSGGERSESGGHFEKVDNWMLPEQNQLNQPTSQYRVKYWELKVASPNQRRDSVQTGVLIHGGFAACWTELYTSFLGIASLELQWCPALRSWTCLRSGHTVYQASWWCSCHWLTVNFG